MSSTRAWTIIGALGSVMAAGACSLLYDTNELTGGALPRTTIDAEAPDATIFGVAPTSEGGADAEIDAGPAVRVTTGLVAFFAFDENQGTTVHDTADGGDNLELEVRSAPAPDGDGGLIEAGNEVGISWAPGRMTVGGRVIGESTQPARAIQQRCRASGQLTVEAWVRPLNTTQDGPARILTMSYTGSSTRNFTLGQAGGNLIFRIRSDGGYTEVKRIGALDGRAGVLTHLAVTARATGEIVFYVDGARSTDAVPGASFDFEEYGLAIANEIEGFTSERRWRGDYHLVAVYDRVLDAAEIAQNLRAGPEPRP